MYLVVPPGGSFPETRRIELGPGALTIGRAEGCAIRVDVPGVDQEHAKISEVALIALGPDCAIGDVPLDAGSRRLVMPGDEIQIGSVVVALEGDDPSIAVPGSNADITERMAHAAKPMEAPRVRVVEGANFGDELVLKEDGREYTVGRGPKSDLVIEDREVSREHIRLMRKGYLVYVKDLGSTRGSWLGRSAVYTGATVEWARPRMLRLGATVLSLELPEAIRRAVPGAQPSAPMTPPPRSRNNLGGGGTPPTPDVQRGSNTLTPSPSQPPPGSAAGAAVAAAHADTRKLGSYQYELNQQPAPQGYAPHGMHPMPTPGQPMVGPMPISAPMPMPGMPQQMHGAMPGGMAMQAPAPAAMPRTGAGGPSRKAWKKSGPTIGKASGLLLLALAGLVILGGLFVVFSLLE